MKSKKSLFFSPGLVIVALLILIEAFVILSSKGGLFKDEPIGEKQFEILNTYTEAEKALFYIDQSAKYSAYQAFYDLANNGGCNEGNEYLGYSIWKGENNNLCNQNIDDVKNNFYPNLNKNLNEYLKKFESMDIPTDNYILEVEDSNLIGNSKAPINIPIVKDNQEAIGEYSIKPSFNVNISYDFSDYDLLREKAEKLIDACGIAADLQFCITTNKIHIFNDDTFELLDSCEPKEDNNFYQFIEYFESCALSTDSSCICTKNNPSGSGSFQITQEGENAVITSSGNQDLKHTMENIELLDDSSIYALDASYLHRDHEGKIIIQSYFDVNKCTQKPITNFKFCIKNKNNEYYIYNEESNNVELKNVVYKFALDFGETEIIVPKPSKETEIPTETEDIKERIRQIAQEIGFSNIEIAFKLAKHESKVQHCEDKTLNCGTDKQNNVNCHENKDPSGNVVSRDCGMFQINDKEHSALFTPGGQRLKLFGCGEGETVYDLDCNIKSGLSILQQYYEAYGSNTDRYNQKVDHYCKNSELNQKYKSYTDSWDRALRAYNGFGCADVVVASYVEKVNAIT